MTTNQLLILLSAHAFRDGEPVFTSRLQDFALLEHRGLLKLNKTEDDAQFVPTPYGAKIVEALQQVGEGTILDAPN